MIRFGTGGWRAIIGDEFTKANVQILAQAMADKMKTEKVDQEGIVIGYDRRFLAREAMEWMAEHPHVKDAFLRNAQDVFDRFASGHLPMDQNDLTRRQAEFLRGVSSSARRQGRHGKYEYAKTGEPDHFVFCNHFTISIQWFIIDILSS